MRDGDGQKINHVAYTRGLSSMGGRKKPRRVVRVRKRDRLTKDAVDFALASVPPCLCHTTLIATRAQSIFMAFLLNRCLLPGCASLKVVTT